MFSKNLILNTIVNDGIAKAPPERLPEAIEWLEERGEQSGLASPLFVAAALEEIHRLFEDHSESGGVRTSFLETLDQILKQQLLEIQEGDPLSSAKSAKELRDSVRRLIGDYRID